MNLKEGLAQNEIEYKDLDTKPAPLSTILWTAFGGNRKWLPYCRLFFI